MKELSYSVVIATFERPKDLARMLTSLVAQTRQPERVVVIDSSQDEQTRYVVAQRERDLPLLYERAHERSAAMQRNQGAVHVITPLIAFIDDDTVLPAKLAQQMCEPFDADPGEKIGGVAARLKERPRPIPRGLLWWYYRLQAGYEHPTYGGLLFGPAINCYPSYTESSWGELIPAHWLSSTCVFYRTELFQQEKFPTFSGYSFMEDVHLSARIGRTHALYFHRNAFFEHRDAPSTWKRDHRQLARSRLRNQRLVARDVIGLRGWPLEWKLVLHRIFVTIYLLRRRGFGWGQELFGTWGL